jgi:hypothetical protein
MHILEADGLEEGIGSGITAEEGTDRVHAITAGSRLKDLPAVSHTHSWALQALLIESGEEHVGRKYFTPEIPIVTGIIAAHHMSKAGGRADAFGLGKEGNLTTKPGVQFVNRFTIRKALFIDRVNGEVKEAKEDLAEVCESIVKVL